LEAVLLIRSIAPVFFAFALTTVLGTSEALAEDSSLSDAQTNYIGAQMLKGDVEVTIGAHYAGDFNRWEYDQTEYAYWSGNTLYIGAEDDEGNGVDAIAEFFWFESSIDRGSDFYVAVIKARTTPNVAEDWYLEVDEDHPVLSVNAKTDITRGTGAFRWDWSVPFENYGMESYGQVTMRSAYGIGANAEGAAMYAEKYQEDGVKAEVDVQAKGFVDASYSVKTEYSITLWSWYMRVRGEPGEMSWDMTLDNFTLTEESSYHEYFLVMQSDEGVPFVIDELLIGASLDQWWWTVWNQFSVQVEEITLTRPALLPDDEDPEEEDDDTWDDDDDWDPDEYFDDNDDSSSYPVPSRGCSTVPGGLMAPWLLLPLAFVSRRRR
jgi:uncharacterized protein (TIGR03382 family)